MSLYVPPPVALLQLLCLEVRAQIEWLLIALVAAMVAFSNDCLGVN
jgi:hypothetical protein